MALLAVIDCGTNTFNLLIAHQQENGMPIKKISTRSAVKLGEGGINKGFISATAFERGVSALVEFNKIIKKECVQNVLAFGTSALRDASNGSDFISEVIKKTGIEIKLIDGNNEAELIYFGNRLALPMNENISLIMDIGGGSNEFILANNTTIFWKQSFKLGAARLLEKFNPEDPISETTISNLDNYLSEQLVDLFEAIRIYKPIELIGSSGAFDSIIEMICGELEGEPLLDGKTGYIVDIENFYIIYDKIIASTILERKNIKGLLPMRVDMIVISCFLIHHILKNCNLRKIRVSTYSLKEGALWEFIQQKK